MASRAGFVLAGVLAGCGGGPAPLAPAAGAPATAAPAQPAGPGLEAFSGPWRVHFQLSAEPCPQQGTHDATVDVAIAGPGAEQSMSWSERDDPAALATGLVDRTTGQFSLIGAGGEVSVIGRIGSAAVSGTRRYFSCRFDVTGVR